MRRTDLLRKSADESPAPRGRAPPEYTPPYSGRSRRSPQPPQPAPPPPAPGSNSRVRTERIAAYVRGIRRGPAPNAAPRATANGPGPRSKPAPNPAEIRESARAAYAHAGPVLRWRALRWIRDAAVRRLRPRVRKQCGTDGRRAPGRPAK